MEPHPVRGGHVTLDTGADPDKQRGPEEATPVHSPHPPPRPVVPPCERRKYKVGAAEREKGGNTGADLPSVYKPIQKNRFWAKTLEPHKFGKVHMYSAVQKIQFKQETGFTYPVDNCTYTKPVR